MMQNWFYLKKTAAGKNFMVVAHSLTAFAADMHQKKGKKPSEGMKISCSWKKYIDGEMSLD